MFFLEVLRQGRVIFKGQNVPGELFLNILVWHRIPEEQHHRDVFSSISLFLTANTLQCFLFVVVPFMEVI